jgi:hypothetical protein
MVLVAVWGCTGDEDALITLTETVNGTCTLPKAWSPEGLWTWDYF